MILRNKKTGEIINSKDVLTDEFIIDLFSKDFNYFISKLDKIQEEWEAVKDPLIKDEKIRKAVRAWAEANRDVNKVIYGYDTNKVYCEIKDIQSEARIRFNFLFIKELNTYEVYTITELCEEEKKC